MGDTPLPQPESEQLAALIGEGDLRLLYGLLHRRRQNPPSKKEIGFFLGTAGLSESAIDRCIRGLRDYFDVEIVGEDPRRYRLQGWATKQPSGDTLPLSVRRRAQALAPSRCAQCGQTPLDHGVVLDVDLRVPSAWGGTTEPENLQPLCEDCLEGRRQYLETFAPHSDKIRLAANCDEPQRRIGELLKAFGHEWVSSELIGIVASAKEFQEDYQRRIRDLRFLGWDYEQRKGRNEGARVRTYYRLIRWEPWPENIHAAITAEEGRRKAKRAAGDQTARSRRS